MRFKTENGIAGEAWWKTVTKLYIIKGEKNNYLFIYRKYFIDKLILNELVNGVE